MQAFDLQLPLDVIHVCQQLQDNDAIQMHTVNGHGEQVILTVKKLTGTHWVNISFEGMGGGSIFEEISGRWSCQIDHLIVPQGTDMQGTMIPQNCAVVDKPIDNAEQTVIAYTLLAENIELCSTTKPDDTDSLSKTYAVASDKNSVSTDDVPSITDSLPVDKVPCPHCSQPQSRRQLAKHIKYRCTKNAARVKYLRCRICGYGTPHADRLAEHARTHADGRKFKCTMCSRSYVSKAGLTVHTRKKHALVKRNPITYIACDVCGKTFMHKSRLEAHMNIHTGERRFACDVCGKTFNESGTMRSHRRTQHLKQYRYHCETCGHGVEKLRYLATHRCRFSVVEPAAKTKPPAKEISTALLQAVVQQTESESFVATDSCTESTTHNETLNKEIVEDSDGSFTVVKVYTVDLPEAESQPASAVTLDETFSSTSASCVPETNVPAAVNSPEECTVESKQDSQTQEGSIVM